MYGLALFAGGGGLELGVSIAEPGYRAVCHVEREAYAAACLVARMEEAALEPAPVWDDVATFDGRAWRDVVDIVTAGYPCQGESNAGKRRGTEDERWLWPEVARILEETGAPVFFGENVGAHLSRSARVVVGELQDMGFRVAAGLFTAFEGGASHERERLFVLAHASSEPNQRWRGNRNFRGAPPAESGEGRERQRDGDALDDGCEDLADSARRRRRQVERRQAAGRQPDPTGEDLADAESMLRGQIVGNEPHRDVRRLERRTVDAERLPLFAPGPADHASWLSALQFDPTLEPAIRGMANGMAPRVDRLRLLGNGVVPLQAAYAYRTLKTALSDGDGKTERSTEVVLTL